MSKKKKAVLVVIMQENMIDEITKIKDVLPKKQQRLCHYLVMNYEQVGVMTVAELAQAAEVGTTTVMRLVQTLGCSSFGAFKKELLNAALMRTTTSYRGLKQSFNDPTGQTGSDSFSMVMSDGICMLENLGTPSNRQQFERVIQMLLGARRICPLGLRSSRPMALYFEYAVNCFYPHVMQLSHDLDYVYDRASLYLEPKDVLLVISIWPCTKKTIRVAQMCHDRGVPIALITNTSLNPITKFADAVIDTNSVNHISGDTVILAVIEALVSELGRRTAPESTKNIERIEHILADQDVVLKEY
ncbi:MAG: MurR/RpiR family transcriptional regulator [Lawsonibacter sp.]|nr:MurR/RpiR family transcriptional regulator [Lawsonibacter sp.]